MVKPFGFRFGLNKWLVRFDTSMTDMETDSLFSSTSFIFDDLATWQNKFGQNFNFVFKDLVTLIWDKSLVFCKCNYKSYTISYHIRSLPCLYGCCCNCGCRWRAWQSRFGCWLQPGSHVWSWNNNSKKQFGNFVRLLGERHLMWTQSDLTGFWNPRHVIIRFNALFKVPNILTCNKNQPLV